jgi:A/G-specific adenine glycosylase
MDVGAMFCRARAPRCPVCPARTWCRYASADVRDAPRRISRRGGTATPAVPFMSTTRWLRGRILDRLRAAEDGTWVAFPGEVGTHDGAAVEAALVALAHEGMIELHSADPPAARLATA